jgi:hypothetical protein
MLFYFHTTNVTPLCGFEAIIKAGLLQNNKTLQMYQSRSAVTQCNNNYFTMLNDVMLLDKKTKRNQEVLKNRGNTT